MELYNQNEQRRYPFVDDANLSGTVNGEPYTLQDSVFVELRLALTQSVPAGPARVQRIQFVGLDMLVDIDFAGYTVQLAIGVAVPDPGQYWVVRGTDSFSGITFLCVLGSGLAAAVSALADQPLLFNTPPTLLPACIRNLTPRPLSIGDGVTRLTGAVVLKEGYNCRIDVNEDTVRLTPAPGAGLGFPCDEATDRCSSVLFRVNGQAADADSEFSFVAGTGLQIVPHPDEHAIDVLAIPTDECA